MNLFEIGEEQKLQKTVRVLWYPNITFQKDLEKDSYIQVEHEDGNNRNNSVENFSFVTRPANAAKGECKGYGETEELMNKILTTIRKYK